MKKTLLALLICLGMLAPASWAVEPDECDDPSTCYPGDGSETDLTEGEGDKTWDASASAFSGEAGEVDRRERPGISSSWLGSFLSWLVALGS